MLITRYFMCTMPLKTDTLDSRVETRSTVYDMCSFLLLNVDTTGVEAASQPDCHLPLPIG